MFVPLCLQLIFVLDHICISECVTICNTSLFKEDHHCMCLCVVRQYSLKSTSPQQSGRDERGCSQRDAACLWEKSLNNRFVAVSGCNSSCLCGGVRRVVLLSVMHEACRLCCPIVTPQILTSNQINSV